jgi:hypothetical protein
MNLEQQVCSLDFAKRLKELGVKQESLYLWSEHTTPATLWNEGAYETKYEHRTTYPCYAAFTVAELGEMLKPHWKQVRDDYASPTTDFTDEEFFATLFSADFYAGVLIYFLENKLVTV